MSGTPLPNRHTDMKLTSAMKQALRIAAAANGEIVAVRSPDWRYANVTAVRTAWALERRGLIARQWTGQRDTFGSACYALTRRGSEVADSIEGSP